MGNQNQTAGQATAPRPTASPTPVQFQPYQPGQPAAGTGPNIWQQSAGAYGDALSGTQAAMGMPNIGAFQNPFNEQVYDRSLAQLNRARQMTMNDVGAQATAANAFGGSRHGIVEAETNRGFADAAADMGANLNMQGFDRALSAAQQQQQAQMAGAGQMGTLANLGFGFGQQLTQNLQQQGLQQQAIQQAIIDAARQQYGGMTGYPAYGVDLYSRVLGAAPYSQTQTTSQSPGLLGILGAGLSLL